MKLNKLFLTAIAASLLFTSCSNDDDSPVASGQYESGILILNQGGFGAGNASVSFLSENFELENNIFAGVNNGMILGDTGQDIGLIGDLAYIVLNVSNKIEIVNRYTFEHVGTINTGLNNPRYIAFTNGKAFVTNWGNAGVTTDDYVAVINLNSNTVTSTIPVAEGPERIIEESGRLYVAHYGGLGYGNNISVIDGINNTFLTTINVGYVPNSLEIVNGRLYVMSGVVPSWSQTLPESAGSLTVINVANNSVINTLEFPGVSHPSNMDIENGSLYYTVGSGIYKMNMNDIALPATPLFTTTAQGAYGVYSFAVRGSHIYLGDAVDYNSAGKVYVHSLTGTPEHNYTVGVVPAGFYFNN